MNYVVDRAVAKVQASQKKYLDYMERQWERFLAGEITHEQYWEISNGEPLRINKAEIAAATYEYDHS